MITIYHNPRCSKSREGLQLLEQQDKPFTIVKYLDGSITQKELEEIVKKLGIKPLELVRQKEAVWIENYKGKNLSDDEIVSAMLLHPNLIERPIVINGEKAVIARPANAINSII